MDNRDCLTLKKRKEIEGEMDPLDQKEAQAGRKALEPSRNSHCPKCVSVLEELKKMKIKENALKKKLSVKIGTIDKLRNMLEEAENKAKVLTSRALSAESALTAIEVRAEEAEKKLAETQAKFAEADARARNTKVQVLEIDVKAQKAEVKACKFEVKLQEAEGWAQKAKLELAEAAQRARDIEKKLMEALKRACSAEEKIKFIEARMEESQRRTVGGRRVEGGKDVLIQTVTMGRMPKPEARIKEELAEAKVVRQPSKPV